MPVYFSEITSYTQGFDRQLQAGEYKLSPAMNGIEIAQKPFGCYPR